MARLNNDNLRYIYQSGERNNLMSNLLIGTHNEIVKGRLGKQTMKTKNNS
jgi:hypothetical protein